MEGVLGARESGRFIFENSRDVSISEENVTSLAKTLMNKVKQGNFSVKGWRDHELNPQTMDEDAVNWVFVSAVLNFSFWTEEEDRKKRYMVKYKDKEYAGYWALCAAMDRALDEGNQITNPEFFASVDEATLRKIFRSDSESEIPMFEERIQVLHEAGKVLMEKFQGSFANMIKEANKSCQALIRMVLKNFPGFRDVAEFEGKQVGIFKRVQILIGDVWGCCEGQGLGEFHDIDTITMFADYRVPQALVYFGVMKYSDKLMERLKTGYVFKSGERQEVEIRGVSIWACELVRDELQRLVRESDVSQGSSVNAILIDFYLWNIQHELAGQMKHIPFHKCRSIYY